MANQTKDDWTYSELYVAVMAAGWDAVHTAYTSHGATVTFDPINLGGVVGTEKRYATGKDEDDALRNFLAKLGVPDERSEDQLYHAVLLADWNIGMTVHHSYGMTLTFRYKYTSDFPGVVTREVSGTDTADAMRKFLAQLKEEEAAELVSESGD